MTRRLDAPLRPVLPPRDPAPRAGRREAPGAAGRLRREAAWVAASGAAAAAGSAVALWPLPRAAGWAVTPDPGDPLLVAYILGYGAHAVAHSPLSLFDANVLHPAPGSLAFTESFLGMSVPLAPLFWLTQNAALLLNAAVFSSLILSSVGAHLVLRHLRCRPPVALVGGLAFALMPYRVLQVGHLHVLAVHLLPFALLAAFRLRERPGPARAAVLAVVLGAQLWSSLTAGAFTLVAVACWACTLLPTVRTATREAFTWGVAAVAAALVLAGPLLATYLEVREGRPEAAIAKAEPLLYSATPGAYLASPAHPSGPLRALYQPLRRQSLALGAAPSEKMLFPGLWSLVAGGAGLALLARPARPGPPRPVAGAVATFALMVAAGVLLSFGPRWGGRVEGFPLPTVVLYNTLPLLRVPARFGLLAHAGLVFLGALALDRAPRLPRRALVVASLAVLLLDAWPGAVPLVAAPVPTAAHEALRSRPGAVLALPLVQLTPDGQVIGETFVRDAVHMYLSTAHFRPLVNGYSQFLPHEYLALAAQLQDFPSPRSLAALRDQDVSTVVVQTDLLPGTPWEDVERRLAGHSEIVLVASEPGVRVYELQPGTGVRQAGPRGSLR